MSIKNIALVKPVDMFNKEENTIYINEEGLILVEFEDNSRRYLDVGNKVDITDYKNWIPLINETSKMEFMFRGDTEYYN
jgi:hypothetical protein